MSRNFNATALAWTKTELDQLVAQARLELQEYVEGDQSKEHLRQCAQELSRLSMTLKVMELHSAALLAQEMGNMVKEIHNNTLKGNVDDGIGAVVHGMLQLPDFLEYLGGGNKDIPSLLLPLINNLRELRGQRKVHESALFLPDLSVPPPSSIGQSQSYTKNDEIMARAQYLRAIFQSYLLRWLKSEGTDAGEALEGLVEVCDQMANALSHPMGKLLFWVAAACFDGVRHQHLGFHLNTKHALAKVEKEIARIAQGGHAVINQDPPMELLRQLLYFVAIDGQDQGRLHDVRQLFNLDDFVSTPQELEEALKVMSGRNQDALSTIATVLKEDIMKVKDNLDLFVRTQDSVSRLTDQNQILHRVGETLAMIGVPSVKDELIVHMASIDRIAKAVDDEIITQDQLQHQLLDVAAEMLVIDARIEEQVCAMTANRQTAQQQDVQNALFKEAVFNITKVKTAVINFIATQDNAGLKDVPLWLHEVSSALTMLGNTEASPYFAALERVFDLDLIHGNHRPTSFECDRLADALVCLEYFIEAIRDYQPHTDRILDLARENLIAIHARHDPLRASQPLPEQPLTPSPADLTTLSIEEQIAKALEMMDEKPSLAQVVVTETPSSEFIPSQPAPEQPAPSEPSVVEQAIPQPSAPVEQAPTPSPAPVSLPEATPPQAVVAAPEPTVQEKAPVSTLGVLITPMDGSTGVEIDDDLREVFQEELGEEISSIGQHLLNIRAAHADDEAVKNVRKSFHTLKGSGRMMGASSLGEMAWAVENVLNKVIEGNRPLSHHVISLMHKGWELTKVFQEALAGQERYWDLPAFLGWAQALAQGEERPWSPSEPTPSPVVSDTSPPPVLPQEPVVAVAPATNQETLPDNSPPAVPAPVVVPAEEATATAASFSPVVPAANQDELSWGAWEEDVPLVPASSPATPTLEISAEPLADDDQAPASQPRLAQDLVLTDEPVAKTAIDELSWIPPVPSQEASSSLPMEDTLLDKAPSPVSDESFSFEIPLSLAEHPQLSTLSEKPAQEASSQEAPVSSGDIPTSIQQIDFSEATQPITTPTPSEEPVQEPVQELVLELSPLPAYEPSQLMDWKEHMSQMYLLNNTLTKWIEEFDRHTGHQQNASFMMFVNHLLLMQERYGDVLEHMKNSLTEIERKAIREDMRARFKPDTMNPSQPGDTAPAKPAQATSPKPAPSSSATITAQRPAMPAPKAPLPPSKPAVPEKKSWWPFNKDPKDS